MNELEFLKEKKELYESKLKKALYPSNIKTAIKAYDEEIRKIQARNKKIK